MQFIKTADLKPGMRLAKPIYNKIGVLLYGRDTRLTPQGINSIENFGLIGIFILEPAEPVPPVSEEDLKFEQLQTIYLFKLKENMDKLLAHLIPDTLSALTDNIQLHFGGLNHKVNFTQTLRSSADFVYKHSISTAILCAMIANRLQLSKEDSDALITAALLYNFGYLYVPQSVLDKGEPLSESDIGFIQMNLERGYEAIRPCYDACDLPKLSLDIIQQMIFQSSRTFKIKAPSEHVQLLYDILKAADRFDHLTAMNINHTPLSEIAAMNTLYKERPAYNRYVINALADCIHILPTGACVDLSNGEKALVLEENAADFMHPMILKFSNNKIYDLSIPSIGRSLRVLDIMKTMDNRIAIDEEALKHFVADKHIRETADRFRRRKLEAAQHKQLAARQEHMNSMLSETPLLAEELAELKPVKRKIPHEPIKSM